MTEAEWEEKKHDVFILKEGIHDEKSLSEYLCQEQEIRDTYDNV